VCRVNSAGIATRYGLDGTGIEYLWGREFPHLSRPALGPPQFSTYLVPGLFTRRVKRPGSGFNYSPTSSAEVKERVELYFLSLCGPSWPVLEQNLPYFICSVKTWVTSCEFLQNGK
jgi:hypothetical protein